MLTGNSTHLMKWTRLMKPGYITPTRCSLGVKMGGVFLRGEMNVFDISPFYFYFCIYLFTPYSYYIFVSHSKRYAFNISMIKTLVIHECNTFS